MIILQPAPSLACTAPTICGSRLAGDADSATRPIPGKPSPTRPALHPIPVGAGLPAMLTLHLPHRWQASSHKACTAPNTCGSRLTGDADSAPAPSLASNLPSGLHCTQYLWEPACRRCLPCNPPHRWQASSHKACTAPDTCGSRLAGDADSATRPIPGLRCTQIPDTKKRPRPQGRGRFLFS